LVTAVAGVGGRRRVPCLGCGEKDSVGLFERVDGLSVVVRGPYTVPPGWVNWCVKVLQLRAERLVIRSGIAVQGLKLRS
jgi:hypothetical protein